MINEEQITKIRFLFIVDCNDINPVLLNQHLFLKGRIIFPEEA